MSMRAKTNEERYEVGDECRVGDRSVRVVHAGTGSGPFQVIGVEPVEPIGEPCPANVFSHQTTFSASSRRRRDPYGSAVLVSGPFGGDDGNGQG